MSRSDCILFPEWGIPSEGFLFYIEVKSPDHTGDLETFSYSCAAGAAVVAAAVVASVGLAVVAAVVASVALSVVLSALVEEVLLSEADDVVLVDVLRR